MSEIPNLYGGAMMPSMMPTYAYASWSRSTCLQVKVVNLCLQVKVNMPPGQGKLPLIKKHNAWSVG